MFQGISNSIPPFSTSAEQKIKRASTTKSSQNSQNSNVIVTQRECPQHSVIQQMLASNNESRTFSIERPFSARFWFTARPPFSVSLLQTKKVVM
jgi:hypothetical protein